MIVTKSLTLLAIAAALMPAVVMAVPVASNAPQGSENAGYGGVPAELDSSVVLEKRQTSPLSSCSSSASDTGYYRNVKSGKFFYFNNGAWSKVNYEKFLGANVQFSWITGDDPSTGETANEPTQTGKFIVIEKPASMGNTPSILNEITLLTETGPFTGTTTLYSSTSTTSNAINALTDANYLTGFSQVQQTCGSGVSAVTSSAIQFIRVQIPATVTKLQIVNRNDAGKSLIDRLVIKYYRNGWKSTVQFKPREHRDKYVFEISDNSLSEEKPRTLDEVLSRANKVPGLYEYLPASTASAISLYVDILNAVPYALVMNVKYTQSERSAPVQQLPTGVIEEKRLAPATTINSLGHMSLLRLSGIQRMQGGVLRTVTYETRDRRFLNYIKSSTHAEVDNINGYFVLDTANSTVLSKLPQLTGSHGLQAELELDNEQSALKWCAQHTAIQMVENGTPTSLPYTVFKAWVSSELFSFSHPDGRSVYFSEKDESGSYGLNFGSGIPSKFRLTYDAASNAYDLRDVISGFSLHADNSVDNNVHAKAGSNNYKWVFIVKNGKCFLGYKDGTSTKYLTLGYNKGYSEMKLTTNTDNTAVMWSCAGVPLPSSDLTPTAISELSALITRCGVLSKGQGIVFTLNLASSAVFTNIYVENKGNKLYALIANYEHKEGVIATTKARSSTDGLPIRNPLVRYGTDCSTGDCSAGWGHPDTTFAGHLNTFLTGATGLLFEYQTDAETSMTSVVFNQNTGNTVSNFLSNTAITGWDSVTSAGNSAKTLSRSGSGSDAFLNYALDINKQISTQANTWAVNNDANKNSIRRIWVQLN